MIGQHILDNGSHRLAATETLQVSIQRVTSVV